MAKKKEITKSHRMTISFSPESYEVLSRVSEASGSSISSFLDQLIKESAPSLYQMAKALDQAKERNLEALDTLTEAIHIAMHQGSQTAMDLDKEKKLRRRSTPKD